MLLVGLPTHFGFPKLLLAQTNANLRGDDQCKAQGSLLQHVFSVERVMVQVANASIHVYIRACTQSGTIPLTNHESAVDSSLDMAV